MPAPPMPWMTRPVSMVGKLWERAQMRESMAKKRIEGVRRARRPKMSERVAIRG